MTAAPVDARLRRAVDASIGWYEDILALHGIGSRLEDGLWSSVGPPPPLHSDVVVVEPEVTSERVFARLAGRTRAGFKDSFGTIDGSGGGMDLLFSATWIHREPEDRSRRLAKTGWSVVSSRDELAEWTAGHDTEAVLLPGLLDRGHFKILARRHGGGIAAGAVARLGSGVVDVSNVHAARGESVDWAELAVAIDSHYPGRPLVGYEQGADLSAALAAGFVGVGGLRVWVR